MQQSSFDGVPPLSTGNRLVTWQPWDGGFATAATQKEGRSRPEATAATRNVTVFLIQASSGAAFQLQWARPNTAAGMCHLRRSLSLKDSVRGKKSIVSDRVVRRPAQRSRRQVSSAATAPDLDPGVAASLKPLQPLAVLL